ncbi:IS3 family transposase [Sulfurimonas sp.]|uniref:IS3 family transposase n=2 Tax=Sulfurimonas sp. TaxID=2022749 RepID=UPI003D129AE1
MARRVYSEEFRVEAVKQVTKNGYSITDTAERLGVHPDSLRSWVKRLESPEAIEKHKVIDEKQAEIKRLQKELKRVTEERDIFKKGRSVLCKPHRLKYLFIKEYSKFYTVGRLCKVMQVHRSGYYQWLKQPISNRELENQKLLVHIKEAYKESNGVYGHRNIHKDLKELGIHVNKKRVARLMSEAKLYGVGTYKRRPKSKVGPTHKAHPNHLHQCFITNKPNDTWVSDITYIKTHEGWIYLATVIDLYSRKIIGWATGHRQSTQLIIKALESAVSRLTKNDKVILHSDQGSQYSSYEYKQFAKKHNIIPSMSRRGNCYDNAVAESFFKTFKKELVRKQIFLTREIAASKIFEYIEMFYNSKRRHSYLGYISPNEFEKRYNLESLKN